MAYSAQQNAFIDRMNQIDRQHRALAKARNGKPANVKKVKVAKPPRVKGPRTAAPKPPALPTDQALINAAVRSRFAPQEQALNNTLNSNTRYTSGLGDWYGNALNEIRGIQAAGNAATSQMVGQVQQYASQPTLPNAADQQAATARNNLNAEFAAKLGANGISNAGALDRIAAAMLIQQGNQRNAANVERQQLLGQQGSLGQQKADYGLTYGADLQSARDKAALDDAKNQLAAKALGLKIDEYENVKVPLAKSLAGDRRNKQKVARSKTRQARQQNEISNALKVNDLALKAYKLANPDAGKKNAGSNSTYSKAKIQGFRANWDYARATAQQLKKQGTVASGPHKGKPITVDDAYQALLGATKDPDIAKAAAYLGYGKAIPPALRQRLAVKGVHPPKVKKQANLGTAVVNVFKKLTD